MIAQSTQKPLFERVVTAEGRAWRPRIKLAELKTWIKDRIKQGAIGGEQDGGFEQSFSSLAYSYIKDKAPRLLDYMVGFQLVDRNEDNTKAAGIFGFKVGDQWLYVPVFFLNGDLKGHELLYIKNQDTFVPLKENWVNYIISCKPHVLGAGSERTTQQLGGLMPNLWRLAVPPTYGKTAADCAVHVSEWARPALSLLGAIKTASPVLFADHDGLSNRFDLGEFLSSSFPLLKAAYEKCYRAYPGIKQGFDRFYGKDFFLRTAELCRGKIAAAEAAAEKRAESLLKMPKKASVSSAGSLICGPEHPLKSGALRIYTFNAEKVAVEGEDAESLSGDDREHLANYSILIKDKRDPQQTSQAYRTDVGVSLMNPGETNLYEVLEKPASFDRMLVIAAPWVGNGQKRFSVVVRLGDTRAWLNTHRTNIWTKDPATREAFTKWVGGLGDAKPAEGGYYLAIGPEGDGTCPFRVREDYGNGRYNVSWEDYGKDRPVGLPSYRHGHGSSAYDNDDYSDYDAKLTINSRPGAGLRAVRGELFIPSSFKILKLKDPPKREKDDDMLRPKSPAGEFPSDIKPRPIEPGNLVDVQLFLMEKTASMRILDTGANDVWIKSVRGNERLSKRAGLISLVRDHGFDEATACLMLKEAAAGSRQHKQVSYRVKYASGFALQPGPSAPGIPEPFMGSEQFGRSNASTIYPQEQNVPVNSLLTQMDDPRVFDPYYQPDNGAMAVGQQAAQTGQKEVFDTAMISGLLKAVRQDSLVDRYLGDLIKALDRVGRIMAMFYWHQEDFADRYGESDMPELEDSLRNTFESLGDVVLYLKEKRVGDVFRNNGSVGSTSEPNIEEVARN